jgi:hypothetical protein
MINQAKKTLSCLFLLFLTIVAKPEGSIDLNKLEGVGQYRLYLEWAPNSPMQVTSLDNVLSTNKIYVYVANGESLLLASSNLNTIPPSKFGSIRYTKPDGVTTVTLTGTGVNGSTGCIFDRLQEKQGPNGLYNGGAGGYIPFTVVADQTGIWTVEFISQDPTTADGTAGGPRLTTVNWPANQKRSVAAWDVSVISAGTLVKGRAYSKWLPLNPGGITTPPSSTPVTAAPELFVKTRDGILYRWKQKGYAGYGHNVFSNNSGILDVNKQRMFESVRYQGIPLLTTRRLHAPDLDDNDSLYTNKMFFNVPDVAMPATARLGASLNHWLNPVFDPSPPNFFFTSVPTVAFPMKGNFTVQYTSVQRATLIIDCNNDGIYGNANDRTIIFYTYAGTSRIVAWDGLDGLGAVLPRSCFMARLTLQNGEVHFPMLDIEDSFGGMELERTNGPGVTPATPDYTIHWNDVPLADNTETPIGSYLKVTPPGGIDSRVNGHRWGRVVWNANPITHTLQYGNERFMDTWSYAITTQNALVYTACSVLPVDIKSFSGKSGNNGNVLNWQIHTDNTNLQFSVLKSYNANTDFIPVTSFKAKTGGQTQHSFTDATNNGAVTYYKLQVTDAAGNSKYSNVIAVKNESTIPADIQLSPNPYKSNAILFVQATTNSTATLKIMNSAGAQVHQQNVTLVKGNNSLTIPALESLQQGIYVITLQTKAGKELHTKIIKTK